jgi:hypothetical protein
MACPSGTVFRNYFAGPNQQGLTHCSSLPLTSSAVSCVSSPLILTPNPPFTAPARCAAGQEKVQINTLQKLEEIVGKVDPRAETEDGEGEVATRYVQMRNGYALPREPGSTRSLSEKLKNNSSLREAARQAVEVGGCGRDLCRFKRKEKSRKKQDSCHACQVSRPKRLPPRSLPYRNVVASGVC